MTLPANTAAAALLQVLREEGVDTWFANPGTTELDLVRAVEVCDGVRVVLGLQENVCTGAADGYGRMTGRPAATLLHLGPGFANGIANLHNARRARTPIVNVIGDHASWHLPYDAPLTSDIESLARPVSGWVRRIASASDAVPAAREAVRQSVVGGQGATLIFPADFQAEGLEGGALVPTATTQTVGTSDHPVQWNPATALERLTSARRIVLLLGGGGERSALGERGQRAAARLVARLGATAFAETFPSRAERGRGLPAFDRLPYFPEPARAVLDPADLVVLAGALPPVTYFGYEGHPSQLVEEGRLLRLADPGEDAAGRLERLADQLEAPAFVAPEFPLAAAEGALTPQGVAAVLARRLPQDAIVSVEGGTCGYPFYAASAAAARHTALTNTGGAIGQGLPVALGAAVACPGRPVVALVSDGSTQYTIQSLWTIAHENLPVVVLVAANHQYAILRNELRRGGAALGARAEAMTALERPRIDWVQLARAYGVEASRCGTVAELDTALGAGFSAGRPMLIEMSL
ncbi:MAG TPA: acetolactate synthase large subunit [Ramlibacter sp.]|nr:acetolactate synthase large subunit [Ramlibacter sp.]